jgi:hypothetical protein
LPTPVDARYMKFVVLSEEKGGPNASISELDVITAK